MRARPPCTELPTRRGASRRPPRRFEEILVETYWPEWWRVTGMQPAHLLSGVNTNVKRPGDERGPEAMYLLPQAMVFCDSDRGATAHTSLFTSQPHCGHGGQGRRSHISCGSVEGQGARAMGNTSFLERLHLSCSQGRRGTSPELGYRFCFWPSRRSRCVVGPSAVAVAVLSTLTTTYWGPRASAGLMSTRGPDPFLS